MAWQVVDWVMTHSKSKGSARAVLIVIAEAAKPDGTGAYPSLSRIAQRAGIGESTAVRAVAELVAKGEIERTQYGGMPGVGGVTNAYRVVMKPTQIGSTPESGDLSDTRQAHPDRQESPPDLGDDPLGTVEPPAHTRDDHAQLIHLHQIRDQIKGAS